LGKVPVRPERAKYITFKDISRQNRHGVLAEISPIHSEMFWFYGVVFDMKNDMNIPF
jgi:hypothetical protein